ncbi:MAG: hypothetical protein HeimC3_16580 [Candidatus Heimdallarchaeota archaeon LC_3]|nr:MAG: hypothetical protein HeimC3_16580 [Candidatus Heimdallarchaeota archaeon LC_3]
MDTEKKIARIVGVLIILALGSSMLSGVFLESLRATDYLGAVSVNENQVLIGVLLLLTLTASVVSIPIVMFPILKKHNESLALGYVSARIFEGFSDVIIAISPLLLVTLSREFVSVGAPVDSYYQTAGTLLLELSDWIGVLENIPYCFGVLIFSYLLYQSKLVPRWLSVWGLIGGIVLLARVPLSMFAFDPLSTAILAIPIIVNELVLAGWLIVKGFNLSGE